MNGTPPTEATVPLFGIPPSDANVAAVFSVHGSDASRPMQIQSDLPLTLQDSVMGKGKDADQRASTPIPDPNPRSFRDSLLYGPPSQNKLDIDSDLDKMSDSERDLPPWEADETSKVDGRLRIKVADRVVQQLADPWPSSVVVKFYGKSIGFNALLNRIQSLWQPKETFTLVDLNNHYYLVNFESEEDRLHALLDGPWVIFGAYLIVQPWSANFDVEEVGASFISARVPFPGLPIHWYKKDFLRLLGNEVGETMKIDIETKSAQLAKFARVAVNIDLSKPLLDRFEGRWFKVEYEGLFTICRGRVGHTKSACKAPGGGREDSNLSEDSAGAGSTVAPNLDQH